MHDYYTLHEHVVLEVSLCVVFDLFFKICLSDSEVRTGGGKVIIGLLSGTSATFLGPAFQRNQVAKRNDFVPFCLFVF